MFSNESLYRIQVINIIEELANDIETTLEISIELKMN